MSRTSNLLAGRTSRRHPRSLARRRMPDALRPALMLRRHPRLWWGCVVLVALAVGASVASVVSRADHAREAWGRSRLAVVVQRDLAAGHRLRPGDVTLEERPVAVTPPGALDDIPVDGTMRADAFRGEVLVVGRLATEGLSPLASSLPAGTRAVSIPVEAGTAPPLEVGDTVDVIVAVPADVAGEGPPGFVLARTAPVVAVDDAAVTVAVAPDVAPKVAVALGAGAVTLALAGA